MTFGFRAINTSGYIQIDEVSQRMCVIQKGTYGGGSDVATVFFSSPITTADQPLIFIRPDVNGAGKQILYESRVLGGPGNWTGFTVRGANVTWAISGLWFVAVFASRSSNQFGMRIYDAGGNLTFDSGHPAAIVTAVLASWTYEGEESLTIGSRFKWSIPRAPLPGEYLNLNGFTLNLLSQSGTGTKSGLWADYANNKTIIYGTDISSSVVWLQPGHKPMLFARIAT